MSYGVHVFTMELTEELPCRESDVAKRLNQNRKVLVELRFSIMTTDDWYREDGLKPESTRPVWIKPSGLAKLAEHFGLKPAEVTPEKNPSAANAAEIRTITVKRTLPRNPLLVEVILADGTVAMMRVKDSSKWMVGMKCEVRSGGAYTKWLIPLRNPRYRGRF